MPSTTLLIPCYNAAGFLPRLMADVRALTVPFDDIIAYDDGSTDETVAVARQLGLRILTPNPNGGVAVARNRLASAASTEWIHFHDADDRIAPDYLEKMLPLATDDADVVVCDSDWVNETDGALQIAWRYDTTRLATDPAPYLLASPLGLNNSVIRLSTWAKSGGCDESLGIWEDADIHFRMALDGARYRHLPLVLSTSLRRPESFSHDGRKCSRYRLSALRGYASLPQTLAMRSVISEQAEALASAAFDVGDREIAIACLAFCRDLGFSVPSSHSRLFRAVRAVLPPLTMLQIQRYLRRHGRASRP